MKILLDTHALLWSFAAADHLGRNAAEAFRNPENRLFFSMAGYWEICIKVSLGELRLSEGWEQTIDEKMRLNGIEWVPISRIHCEGLTGLPFHHRDPFDRLIIAQALAEGMSVISKDAVFAAYPVDVIW